MEAIIIGVAIFLWTLYKPHSLLQLLILGDQLGTQGDDIIL